MTADHPFTNRLIHEKSPYLLQHAHNPVDWYPWGTEAFQAAKDQDKPILLSIGYATCHWCHVMERECFDDVDVANKLNETFVCIKVDREELPEVDSLYMEFAQSMMAGAAGWPLNVILTPELKPFFAATYLPPHSSHGLTGLNELIERIHEVWTGEDREKVLEQAERIVEVFSEHIHTTGEELPEKEDVVEMAENLFKLADPTFGGVRGIPKFPIGYQWIFLLHYASMMKDGRSLFLVERTLDMMHRGGIYDHLGGGFSRYSVDERWLVPHFEKMLYDNALLASCYLEAWKVTQKPLYRQVCVQILDYVLRDMTHPDGGFYSAEDADSEGKEGLFYTWKEEEIKEILGADAAQLFLEYYQVTPKGNFEGRSILNTPENLEEFSARRGLDPKEIENIFDLQKEVLWKVREKRVHPIKDDKILSSWNGLMICSMAEAGAALDNERFSQAAVDAAKFIRAKMWRDGHLLRRWRDGEASFRAGLDEYAFLIKGLLSLFETGHGTEWLSWAVEMTQILKAEFKAENGAYYQTDGKDENILLRKTQFTDGAEPSGNAIHCENLLRLYQLTFDSSYLKDAEDILKAASRYIANYSPGYSYHMMNLLRYYDRGGKTAVVACNKKNQLLKEIKEMLFHSFHTHLDVVWYHSDDEEIKAIIPMLSDKQAVNGKTTLYLCDQTSCQPPCTELSEMIGALSEV